MSNNKPKCLCEKPECKICARRAYHREYRKTYYLRPEVHEKRRALDRQRYKKDPAKELKRRKDWKLRNPEKWSNWLRQHNSKHSPEHYAKTLADQQGKCGICERDLATSPRGAFADHDHATQKARGILCCRCNTMLGWVETSRNYCQPIGRLADYLNKYA